MKINVNVECTPEEARSFMGLPDLSGVHDVYVGKLQSMVEDGVTPDAIERVFRSWGPLGEAGLGAWQRMFEHTSGTK